MAGRLISLQFTAVLAATMAGCGPTLPTTVPVSGKLTFKDGAPIADAMVTLRTVHDGTPVLARATTGADGAFAPRVFRPTEAPGLIPGEYTAVVSLPFVEGPPQAGVAVAPKYTDFDTTDLKCTITSETTLIAFVIDRAAKK